MQSGSLSSHFRDSFSNSFAVINGVSASGLQSRFWVNPQGFGSQDIGDRGVFGYLYDCREASEGDSGRIAPQSDQILLRSVRILTTGVVKKADGTTQTNL